METKTGLDWIHLAPIPYFANSACMLSVYAPSPGLRWRLRAVRSVRNDSTEVAADLCDREMELFVLPELVLAAAHGRSLLRG